MKKIIKFSVFEGYDDGNIGIENKKDIIEKLNKLLSNYFILYMKLLNFHWNIVSKRFNNIHKFFEELYDKIFENIDGVAERIRIIGGQPISSLDGYLKNTNLKEYTDSKIPDVDEMIEEILDDYETIIKQIRDYLSYEDLDNGTSKFLEDLIESHEKDAWMLRSNLEK